LCPCAAAGALSLVFYYQHYEPLMAFNLTRSLTQLSHALPANVTIEVHNGSLRLYEDSPGAAATLAAGEWPGAFYRQKAVRDKLKVRPYQKQVELPKWYISLFEGTLYGLSGYFSSANEFSVGELVDVDTSAVSE